MVNQVILHNKHVQYIWYSSWLFNFKFVKVIFNTILSHFRIFPFARAQQFYVSYIFTKFEKLDSKTCWDTLYMMHKCSKVSNASVYNTAYTGKLNANKAFNHAPQKSNNILNWLVAINPFLIPLLRDFPLLSLIFVVSLKHTKPSSKCI